MYSLKKALLTEAIVSQKIFVERLVDLIKKKPRIIGDASFNSYEQALEFVTNIKEDNTKDVDVDGLKLSSEEAESYLEMKKNFEQRENKRLKTLTIKKNKGIKTTKNDETPIVFNAGVFFKRNKETKLLQSQERNICLEIIKVNSILGLSSIKDKKTASKTEAIMTKQISRFLNIDGTPINFKAIMPLYDKMIEYIEKNVDISVDSCIKAADLYIKELYSTASVSERQEIDGGNFDFSIVFSRSNYFVKYSKIFSNEETSVIHLYEDANVKIVYPTSVQAFNKEISSKKIKGGLSWCTQDIGSWQSHHKDFFVAILYDKRTTNDRDPNFIISLKINYGIEDPYDLINYNETCDRDNDHMYEESVTEIISYDVIASLTRAVNSKLKYFEPNYIKKNLEEISETLSSLVRSGRVDIAKEIISKSIVFSSHTETAELIRTCLSNTSDDSERILLKAIFEIAANGIFYNSFDPTKLKLFNYDFVYDNVVTNLSYSEFYNILFSLTQNSRSHPKYLIAISKCIDKETLKKFLNKEEIINACNIAFNTNNVENFERAASEVINFGNGVFKILNDADATKEFFEIVVSSKGFQNKANINKINFFLVKEIKRVNKEKSGEPDPYYSELFTNINEYLANTIIKNKDDYLDILKRNNLIDIITKVDQTLMREYLEFNIKCSKKGVLSLLDENEVRSNEKYADQFNGILSSKRDLEDVMLSILKDRETLEKLSNNDNSLYNFLLEKSLRDSNPTEEHFNIARFLLESNVEIPVYSLSLCISEFDKLASIYQDINSLPEDLLQKIVDELKSGFIKSRKGRTHWALSNLIGKSCFYLTKKLEIKLLKMVAKLINLTEEDELVADAILNYASGINISSGTDKSQIDIIRHNYINFLLFISNQVKIFLSNKVNERCGKSLDTTRYRTLKSYDMDKLKSARIIVMKGAERFLTIEQEVYDNIVHNTKRPMNSKEVLMNLYILGQENVNIEKSFNSKKISELFQDFNRQIIASSTINNVQILSQNLEICTELFTNNPNSKNMSINRYYARELIESISKRYQELVTNYDQNEQRSLDRLIVAIIENYINFNRENESVGDAFINIKSILERAKKDKSHIFYNQKFFPVVSNLVKGIPKNLSGSSGNYYQIINQLFETEIASLSQEDIVNSEIKGEGTLRNYIKMLLT